MRDKKRIKSGMISVILSAAMLMTAMPAAAAEQAEFSAFSAEETQTAETDVFSAEDDQQEAADDEEFSAGVVEEEELTEGVELEDEEDILSAEAEGTSDGVVELNEENFPDEHFRDVLRWNFDEDGDGKINISDVVEINTEYSSGISSLKGIEFFTDLKVLKCADEYMESFDLSKNEKLEVLVCEFVPIESIDLSNLINLKELNCYSTKLKNLDVSKNEKLEVIDCSYIPIESIDLSNLTNLRELRCASSGLQSLDVSKNEKLEVLDCEYVSIESIDLSNLTNLRELYCRDTKLQNLDVRNNVNLKKLLCNWCDLSSLTLGENVNLETLECMANYSLSELDVSKCINLKELNCSYCDISALNVENNKNLEFLDCERDNLSVLDVSRNTKLIHLICAKNSISTLDVSKNTELELLDCCINPLGNIDVSANSKLRSLFCMDNQLTSLDLSSNKKIEKVYCDGNQIDVIKGGEGAQITCVNKVQTITVTADFTYDLSMLPGKLNLEWAEDWKGGSVKENILTVDKDAKEVTFTYCADLINEGGGSGYRYMDDFKLLISHPVTAPAKVTGLKASSDTSSVKLTWNEVSGATGYKVQRYNASRKKYETIATAKGTSYTDKKLSAATGYIYRVYAYAEKDGKTANGAVSASVKVLTAPSAPGSVKISRSGAKTDKAKATLTFAPSKGASYYDIYKYNVKTKKYENAFCVKGKTLYRYNAGTKKYTRVNSVKATSRTITCTLTNLKLKTDGTQKYVVRAAVQKSGYTTKTSAQSKAVTLK